MSSQGFAVAWLAVARIPQITQCYAASRNRSISRKGGESWNCRKLTIMLQRLELLLEHVYNWLGNLLILYLVLWQRKLREVAWSGGSHSMSIYCFSWQELSKGVIHSWVWFQMALSAGCSEGIALYIGLRIEKPDPYVLYKENKNTGTALPRWGWLVFHFENAAQNVYNITNVSIFKSLNMFSKCLCVILCHCNCPLNVFVIVFLLVSLSYRVGEWHCHLLACPHILSGQLKT